MNINSLEVFFEQILGTGTFATVYKGRLSVVKDAHAEPHASSSEVAGESVAETKL